MAGLEDIASGVPQDGENASLGAGRMRTLTDKTKETINLEHQLAGEHKIPNGNLSLRPSAGHSGRLFISTAAEEPDLQYDNGTQWVNLTSNNELNTVSDDLAAHKTASTIDHPDGSVKTTKLADKCVTSDKLSPGTVVKRHIDADLDGKQEGDATLKPLINGSEIDSSWHSHPKAQVGITFITPTTIDGRNHLNDDWLTKNLSASGTNENGETCNATNIVPAGATVVLLDARCVVSAGGNQDINPAIRARATGDDGYIHIVGGFLGPWAAGSMSDTRVGFKGQGFCKLNVTDDGKRKFQYKVKDCNVMWEIRIIGWM